jgi:hypothetical protein
MESLERRAEDVSTRFFKGFVRYSEPLVKYVVKAVVVYAGCLYYGLRGLQKRFLRFTAKFRR